MPTLLLGIYNGSDSETEDEESLAKYCFSSAYIIELLKILKFNDLEQMNNNIEIAHSINHKNIDFMTLRENIYDILIYNIDINLCINYIIRRLIEKNIIKFDKLSEILKITFKFYLYYNNNYRPIYHLERYILNIISIINEL